jgi:glutamate dehydrogenase/leucine dehydrogenase
MSLFETAEFDGHEAVAFLTDRRTRLRAILALHDTTLGPALGGCQVLPYAFEIPLASVGPHLSQLRSALANHVVGG